MSDKDFKNTFSHLNSDDHDNQNSLYCSFCEKSQHEVEKLIAGPSVCICNECTEICDDLIWGVLQKDGKSLIRIKLREDGNEITKILHETMINAIAEQLPEYNIKYSHTRNNVAGFQIVHFEVSSPNIEDEEETNQKIIIDRDEEVRKLAQTIAVISEKFKISDRKRNILERELMELKAEYLDYIRSVSQTEKDEFSTKAVMFLDVVNYSKLINAEREEILNLLRSLINPLLIEKGATEPNTWGDAIVCTFVNPEVALLTAIKFCRHLSVENYDTRIGMAWGEIRTAFNPAIGRRDIDGEAVNLAARLEPLAPVGGILLSQDFGGFSFVDQGINLVPNTVEIKKDFGLYKAGNLLDTYILSYQKN